METSTAPSAAAAATAAAASASAAPSAAVAAGAAAATSAAPSAATAASSQQQVQQQTMYSDRGSPDPATVAAAQVAHAASLALAGLRSRSLVMDLGGDSLKVGWAGSLAPRILPNCAVKNKRDSKWLVADQMLPEVVPTSATPGRPAGTNVVHKISDYSGLYVRRPHERGFVVNWELENQIWSRALHRSVLDPTNTLSASALNTLVEESSLLLTLPVCAPSALAKDVDENVFEKWHFQKYRRTNPAPLAHRAMLGEMYPSLNVVGADSTPVAPVPSGAEQLHGLCALVVDSGYSFTHIMPVYQGKTITAAVKRVNVGGKLMTNYLKELISYRAWNMMDETYIINDVKEKLCYVSTDFERELQAARRSRKVAEKLRREYVLPNGSTVLQGYVRDASSPMHPDDQVLLMGNERLSVPEVLFTPLDIGLQQGGLVESIVSAVEATPAWMHGLLYDNIVLVGGNAKLPNFQTRIERELRPRVPTEYRITCRTGKDPVSTTWRGGSLIAQSVHSGALPASTLAYVTKAEYAEYGSEALTRKWEGDEDDDSMEQ